MKEIIDYLDKPPQRYDHVFQKNSGSREMVEDPKGEFVKFDDMDLYMFEGSQLMLQSLARLNEMEALLLSIENWLRPEVVKEPDRTFFWKIVELRRKHQGLPPSTLETGAKHTTEEDFQHFLSYSGLGSVASETQAIQNDLRKAFYAGAGVDLPKKTKGEQDAS